MLYKRRCNAGKGGRRGEKREEERRRGSEEKEWLGEIVQGESTWGLIPSNLLTPRHPTRRDLPIPPNLASVTPPILHSPFPRHTGTDRDPSIVHPLLNSISFLLLLHILSLSLCVPLLLSHSLATFFSNYSSSDAPHCYLILSVPFPHHILAPFLYEPYLHEAVPPRCFNHLYLFHFLGSFFSHPFRSDRRGFHLNPLSTYMRGDASGVSPYASPYHFRYPFRA